MTEHVCKWEFRGNGDIEIMCNHKNCWETLSFDQAEARLNATERLSANDARYYGELSGITLIRDAMQTYANILEGKDDREVE